MRGWRGRHPAVDSPLALGSGSIGGSSSVCAGSIPPCPTVPRGADLAQPSNLPMSLLMTLHPSTVDRCQGGSRPLCGAQADSQVAATTAMQSCNLFISAKLPANQPVQWLGSDCAIDECAELHLSESAEQGAVLGGQQIVEGDVLLPDEPGSW